MKYLILTFLAALMLCTPTANARQLFVYNTYGNRSNSIIYETATGSNILQQANVYASGSNKFWLSEQNFATPEDFFKGLADGKVLTLDNPEVILKDEWGCNVLVRGNLVAATPSSSPIRDIRSLYYSMEVHINMTTGVMTYGPSYSFYYIKKDILPGISLDSPAEVLSQLFCGYRLPDVSGDYAISFGLLPDAQTYEPVDGTTFVLDSSGQATLKTNTVKLAAATRTFTVTPETAGSYMQRVPCSNGIWTIWVYDPEKMEYIYADASENCADGNYKIPTASESENRVQKLYAVPGVKGLFRGTIKAHKLNDDTGVFRIFSRLSSDNSASGNESILFSPYTYGYDSPVKTTGFDSYTLELSSGDEGWSESFKVHQPGSESNYDPEYTFEVQVRLSPDFTMEGSVMHTGLYEGPYQPEADVLYYIGTSQGDKDTRTDDQWWLANIGDNISDRVYERILYIPEGDESFHFFLDKNEAMMPRGWYGPGYFDKKEISAADLIDGQTVTLSCIPTGEDDKWILTGWPGGYLKIYMNCIEDRMKLTKVDSPEDATPELYVRDPDYEALYADIEGNSDYTNIPKIAPLSYEGLVNVPKGNRKVELFFSTSTDPDNPVMTQRLNAGFSKPILTDADLTDSGSCYSHSSVYHTHKVFKGVFLTPDTWPGGDVKVSVDAENHMVTFDADCSGIESVRTQENVISPALQGIYTLTGIKLNCRVDELPAGIYIIDGKKRMVR